MASYKLLVLDGSPLTQKALVSSGASLDLLSLRIGANNLTISQLSSTAFDFSAKKLSNIADGVAASDAAAFGQLANYIPTSYLDTDTTLAADSDTKIATQKAVKAYIDNSSGPASSALDGTFVIKNTATQTKLMAFDVSGVTAANTRTLKMADANVDLAALTNSNISASAAIAYSKLALSNSIVNADIASGAAIDYSKLALTSSIVNADIAAAAAIALDKLAALNASIVPVSDASGFLVSSTVTSTELGYVAGVTSGLQNQIDNKLSKSGGTMTGVIAMGTNKITGLGNGTNAADAVNLAQLQAVSAGLVWLSPILDPDLIDANRAAQPGSAVVGDLYIASATAGDWTAGHAYFSLDNAVTWVDLLGRAVIAGDRFGVSMETATAAVGVLSGLDNYTVEILVATPGSITVTSHAPVAETAVYVSEDLSHHFGHQYTYNGTSWIEFGGTSALNAGIGLVINGNVLSVNLGAGISQLPTDEVGIDFKTDGGLWLVDPTSGLASTATDAQLSAKLDGSTLAKSANGLKVATGGIANNEINASAAIAYSKLALTSSIVNADIASGAAIAYSKLALTSSIVNADIASGAAIAYSKLDLSNSIVNADIASGAAIAYSKLSLALSIATGDLVANSVTKAKLNSDVVASTSLSDGIKLDATNALVRQEGLGLVNDNAGTINPRQLVFIKSNGAVDLAKADAAGTVFGKLGLVGSASIATTVSGDIFVRKGGVYGGFTGLTPGADYYMSAATAGAITATPPSASGQFIRKIGEAISATQLELCAFDAIELL